MAKGNNIIVSAEPKGVFKEGIIDGTPLPGTIMQIKAATEPVGGRHTWEVANYGADGDQRVVAVLLEDRLQGKTKDDAYADEDRCFLYFPIAGEELNVRWFAPGTATSDSVAIGDFGIVDDGTGLLTDTTGSPESEPFQALETVSDVVLAGTLVWCMYTGH